MLRKVLRYSAVAALLAAAVLVPAALANAGQDKPTSDSTGWPWTTAHCATGSLTQAENRGNLTMVYGSATLCSPYEPAAQFAIVQFSKDRATGLLFRDQMRPYQPVGERKFGVQVQLTAVNQLCIMSSPTTRIACAELVTDAAGAAYLKPLRTDDPTVTKPVVRSEQQGSPNCGTCF